MLSRKSPQRAQSPQKSCPIIVCQQEQVELFEQSGHLYSGWIWLGIECVCVCWQRALGRCESLGIFAETPQVVGGSQLKWGSSRPTICKPWNPWKLTRSSSAFREYAWKYGLFHPFSHHLSGLGPSCSKLKMRLEKTRMVMSTMRRINPSSCQAWSWLWWGWGWCRTWCRV